MITSKNAKDMMGRELEFRFPPQKIVSLVPSQTEFLLDIGAPVVGRTKFCVHPAQKVPHVSVVGGTKNFRFDVIRELKPDLIIGNKEENYKEGIELLQKEFPVWMSDIYNLDDSFRMMSTLGSMCGLDDQTRKTIELCQAALRKMKGTKSGKVVYLIWKQPWMAAGKDTFIDHMLSYLGFENLATESRYPELNNESIAELNPDKILLSSEPFPFTEKHINEIELLWPNAEVQLVDGELYSWYGSRLKEWK